MVVIILLADILADYKEIPSKIPNKKGKVSFPEDVESRLKIMVNFQKSFEITSRISEILGRLSAIEDENAQKNLMERLKFLTSQLILILDTMPPDDLQILACFLPHDFKSKSKYIKDLADSRVGEKLQALKEHKNGLEVLSEVHDSVKVAILRSLLALGSYPEADISQIVLRKIDSKSSLR